MSYQVLSLITNIISIVGTILVIILFANIKLKSNLKDIDEIITYKSTYDIQPIPKNKITFYSIFKRYIDIVGGILAILILMPIFIITSILCKIEYRDSIFVKTKQVGANGKFFYSFKFRTKYIEHVNPFTLNRNDYSKVGLFLYKTGLENLPMLINIVKGDISFIGRSMYDEFSAKKVPNYVLICKPGLASIWSISLDKQEFKFRSKIESDIFYIKNQSIFLDFKIALRCIYITLGVTGNF